MKPFSAATYSVPDMGAAIGTSREIVTASIILIIGRIYDITPSSIR